MPTKANRWLWRTRGIARGVAGKLFDEQWSVDHEDGEDSGPRDIMSLLGELCAFSHRKRRRSAQTLIDVYCSESEL
jgi:hypothetical protein